MSFSVDQRDDYRRQVAIAIYNSMGDSAPPISKLEALMGEKAPPYEKNPLAYSGWVHKAMGRYCFAMAEKFIDGFEAQRTAWGR